MKIWLKKRDYHLKTDINLFELKLLYFLSKNVEFLGITFELTTESIALEFSVGES